MALESPYPTSLIIYYLNAPSLSPFDIETSFIDLIHGRIKEGLDRWKIGKELDDIVKTVSSYLSLSFSLTALLTRCFFRCRLHSPCLWLQPRPRHFSTPPLSCSSTHSCPDLLFSLRSRTLCTSTDSADASSHAVNRAKVISFLKRHTRAIGKGREVLLEYIYLLERLTLPWTGEARLRAATEIVQGGLRSIREAVRLPFLFFSFPSWIFKRTLCV